MINLIYTILPVITLIAGFYMGLSIHTDKPIEVKGPVEIMKEKKKSKEKEKSVQVLEQYLQNLDEYPNNQKKFEE